MKRKDYIVALIGIAVVIASLLGAFTYLDVSTPQSQKSSYINANTTIPENFYDSQDYNFPYGLRALPFEDTGVTNKYYQFDIYENALEVIIVLDGDPGIAHRNDVNLYLYPPNTTADRENAVAESATWGEMHERIELAQDEIAEFGYGKWCAEVECYKGVDVDCTLQIWVNYTADNREGKGVKSSFVQ